MKLLKWNFSQPDLQTTDPLFLGHSVVIRAASFLAEAYAIRRYPF